MTTTIFSDLAKNVDRLKFITISLICILLASCASNIPVTSSPVESRNVIVNDEQDNKPATTTRVIQAYIDYSAGQYQSALERLAPLITSNSAYSNQTNSDADGNIDNARQAQQAADQTQRVDALLLSSFCHQKLNDYDSAIAALIDRESLLVGNSKAETARYTWQVINNLSPKERQNIIQTTNNFGVRNRLEQRSQGQFATQTELPSQFDQWRPSSADDNKQNIDSQWNATSPKRIAVLLPLTSRYTKAAHAVMDGIEHQHNANFSPYKPSIEFYDIGNDPYQASQYYSSISGMGYDLVIGPIGKDYANQVFSGAAQSNGVSTLLLGGDGDLYNQPYKLFSRLTMSPEAEGIEVANHAKRLGYVTAAVIAPDTATGKRAGLAFQQQWLNQGGNISKTISYSSKQYDHSAQLKQLFDVNQSEYRYNRLANTLGYKPKFSAYSRSDIDFIFMIADNDSGRILRPQINFFSDTNVKVFSTSSVFNGIQDTTKNIDLENTHFPVMPWVLQSTEIAPYAGQLNMLFAMGSDAYKLAANYQSMLNNNTLSIAGNMGRLHIESDGEVIYRPAWAQYKEGKAVANTELPILEDIRQLQNRNSSPSNSTSNNSTSGSNSYDNSNWDTRQSSRKTGETIP